MFAFFYITKHIKLQKKPHNIDQINANINNIAVLYFQAKFYQFIIKSSLYSNISQYHLKTFGNVLS